MMPPFRILLKSAKLVFFTMPLRVAKDDMLGFRPTFRPRGRAFARNADHRGRFFSSGRNSSTLASDRPRALRLISGIS